MSSPALYLVDSFTDQPFRGNPAGVCICAAFPAEETMQAIAKELGFSETAFVVRMGEEYRIRFFSPKMEIPLCGHATLAAAKVVFGYYSEEDHLAFVNIQSIRLLVKKVAEGIEMEFPLYGTVPRGAPEELLAALGVSAAVNSEYNAETRILLVEMDGSEELAGLRPDFARLRRAHDAINGVLVTARSRRADYDFESRYFWPWSGTDEDPVTGGTHTFLADYWAQRLNKTTLRSYQCSERGGFMEVEITADRTVKIRSEAQVIFRGELLAGQ